MSFRSFKLENPPPNYPWGGLFKWEEGGSFSDKSVIVGNSSCVFRPGAPLKENAMWEKIKSLLPDCRNYGWPNRSAEAEKISYKLQCDRHVCSKDRYIPNAQELKEADDSLLKSYVKHDIDPCLVNFDEIALRKRICEVIGFVKRDASPGVPYAFVASTNGKLLDTYKELIIDCVIDRIRLRNQYSLSQLNDMTPEELVQKGLVDPVRVFVKSEPHKIKKLNEGRVRLIHSVSIVDKIIEMVLIRDLTKLEINNWYRIPSKPGIGFTTEDNDLVYEDVISNKPMCASDVEGWDWNVEKWQIVDDAEMVIKLCNNPSKIWEHQVRIGALIECKSVYQFSDGLMVKNLFEGIVNSGKYKTSSGNSRMRTKLAKLVGADKTIAAGDDAVESFVKDAIEKYKRFGFKIKAYDLVEDSFEFCSRIYSSKGSWPINVGKMVMNLIHNTPRNLFEFRMYMMGFENDLGSHPDFENIMQAVAEVGYFEQAGAQEDLIDTNE